MRSSDPRAAIPPMFNGILERLHADAQDLFGSATIEIAPVSYQDRPFSHLLRVEVSGPRLSSRHLFIKITKPKAHDTDHDTYRRRVAADFETSRKIYRAMSSCPELTAVRPVACYADDLTIVTEQAQGETLLTHLEREATWFPSALKRAQLTQTMTNVGRWLRAFQAIEPGASQVVIAELRDYVDLRLTRLVSRRVYNEDMRTRVLRHLDRLGRAVSPDDLRSVIVHADMAPANVLVSGASVVVLDFAMANRGSFLHDISRLHLQLELLTAKPQFRPGTIAILQSALLGGYDAALTASHPLFRFLRMLHSINHFGTLSLRREPFPSNLFSRRVKRIHRNWIERELDADSRTGQS